MKRKILEAGKIVIPRKFADKLGIRKFEDVEIIMEYGEICIYKFNRKVFLRKPYVGIIRKPNSSLMIQIPKEYMRLINLHENSLVELILKENKIVIKKE